MPRAGKVICVLIIAVLGVGFLSGQANAEQQGYRSGSKTGSTVFLHITDDAPHTVASSTLRTLSIQLTDTLSRLDCMTALHRRALTIAAIAQPGATRSVKSRTTACIPVTTGAGGSSESP